MKKKEEEEEEEEDYGAERRTWAALIFFFLKVAIPNLPLNKYSKNSLLPFFLYGISQI